MADEIRKYCGICGKSQPTHADRTDFGTTIIRCAVCGRQLDVIYDDEKEAE